MQLQGKNGYSISYSESIPEVAKTIIVAMHGFCGDKESGCIAELEKKIECMKVSIILLLNIIFFEGNA